MTHPLPQRVPAAAATIAGFVLAIFLAFSASVLGVVALGLLGLLLFVMSAAEPPSRDGWLGAGIGLAVVAVIAAHITANTAAVYHHAPLSVPEGLLERLVLPLVVIVTTLSASRLLPAADRSRLSPRAALATALGFALTLGATCARRRA